MLGQSSYLSIIQNVYDKSKTDHYKWNLKVAWRFNAIIVE